MRFLLSLITAIIVAVAFAEYTGAWGFFAHKQINRMAVFTLPPDMIGFYKKHIDHLTDHAVDADRRRCCDTAEAPRHYLDADRYGLQPFDSIPQRWKEACARYTEDTLLAHGILPWNIERVLRRLTEAFARQDAAGVLYFSSNLGHYVGDAHVPLHTTRNYNGQLTGQKGIHAFWESRLPELFSSRYDHLTGRAAYIEEPLREIWKAVRASYAAKDSVLLFEAELNRVFPPDRKYSYEEKGRGLVRNYSEEYSAAYDSMLNGMVERRMRASIRMTGNLWYTAWVNAGQPDLLLMETQTVIDSLKALQKREEAEWGKGKIKNDREE